MYNNLVHSDMIFKYHPNNYNVNNSSLKIFKYYKQNIDVKWRRNSYGIYKVSKDLVFSSYYFIYDVYYLATYFNLQNVSFLIFKGKIYALGLFLDFYNKTESNNSLSKQRTCDINGCQLYVLY